MEKTEMERRIAKMGEIIVHDISYRTEVDCNTSEMR
jgi:hypothetical protein